MTMNSQRHVIKRQVIELSIPGNAQAHELQNEVSRIYRRKIIPLIDQFCSELSAPDRLHRIDSLEIDLGAVDANRLESDLLLSLNDALPKALQAQIAAQEKPDNASQTPQAKLQSQLELLYFFLRTGALPWWADASEPRLLENCLDFLILNSPRRLTEALRSMAREGNVFQRFANHFSDDSISRVVQLMAPALKPPKGVNAAELLRILQESKIGIARDKFWPTLLRVAGLEGRSEVSTKALTQSALTHVAAVSGATYHSLVTSAADTLKSLKMEIGESLQNVLFDLAQSAGSDDKKSGQEPVVQTSSKTFRERLLADSSEILSEFWAILMETVQNFPNQIRNPILNLLKESETPHKKTERILALLAESLPAVSLPSEKRRQMIAALQELIAAKIRPEESRAVIQAIEPDSDHQGGEVDPLDDLEFSDGDELYVSNAGLVILAPFLSRFFSRVDYLEKGQFKDEKSQQRAAGLLQLLASGESEFPEYLLPLNKALCGIHLTDLVLFESILTDLEAKECEKFLEAIIAQAPILKEMSIDGLRGTFLLREGVLRTRDGAWLLQVERKTHDIVLDRFPWSWEWIKLPWMEKTLRVEW